MKRAALITLGVSFALSILVGGHWYLVQRLILDPRLPAPWTALLVGLVALLGLSLVAGPFAQRKLPRRVSRMLAWPAMTWLGVAFLLLVLVGVTDLAMALAGTAALAAEGALDASLSGERARAALVALTALGACGYGMVSALRRPGVRRVEVSLPRWPLALDGFRVVQISDIHIGGLVANDFAPWLVEQVNALDPDLVAVTGDLVDGGVEELRDDVAPFAGLRGRHGVFFVTGNHDHYSGANDWVECVASLAIRVLRNERIPLEVNGAGFDLAGVDDHRGGMVGESGEDLDKALAGVDPERFVLLLAHDPSTFKRASTMQVDLQLSGHTHGGQIWPFNFMVKLAVPFVAGLYRRGRAQLYVSRGTGFWGPPIRLFAPAEITELILRASPGSPGSQVSQEKQR